MTYNKEEAKVEPRSQEEWLNLILENGAESWGDNITEREKTALHEFYEPYAGRLAELEQQLKRIHESLRLDGAEGKELDYIGKRLGIDRIEAKRATGNVKFTRETPAIKDYLIQQDTVLYTGSYNKIEFVTTEQAIIEKARSDTDSSIYSTTNTSLTNQKTATIDTSFRDSIEVQADFRTTNSSYTATVEVVDVTNEVTLLNETTTSTSFTSTPSQTYDTSSLSGDIDIEYQISISDASASAEIQNIYMWKAGETGAESSIEARKVGSRGNVAAGSITENFDTILGVENITNPVATSGGRNREKDAQYKERIKTQVGEIDTTSGQYIYNQLKIRDFIDQVNYIDNSSDSFSDGLNANEVEIVVDAESGHEDEIADIIFKNMAMGANLVNGVHGTADSGTATLDNGQTFTIPFSKPTELDIYVEASVTTKKEVNKDKLKNSIVEYIGGTKTNGEQVSGEISVGEDVVHGEVDFSIRSVDSVYDVTALSTDTTNPPSQTSNISIGNMEQAVLHHSDITIDLTVQN